MGKGKGKAALGPTPSLLEVEIPSSSPMEALMGNLTLFKELLLKEPVEEVTTTLGLVYEALVIKKVLDLLRTLHLFKWLPR